jgi:hypothetical protein
VEREEIAEIMQLDDLSSGLGTIKNNLVALDRLGVRTAYPLLLLLKELEGLPPEVSNSILAAVRGRRQKQVLAEEEF